jgi:hypothetical protein
MPKKAAAVKRGKKKDEGAAGGKKKDGDVGAGAGGVEELLGAAGSKRKLAERDSESQKVIESLRSALECPICCETMCPPVLQCSSGHPVCSSCSSKLRRCGTCRAKNLKIRNLSLEKLASDHKIKLPCTFESYGCKEEFFYTDLAEHQGACEHRPLVCPHAEHKALFVDGNWQQDPVVRSGLSLCKWKGVETQLAAHLSGAHGATFAPLPRAAKVEDAPPAPQERQKGKGKEAEGPARDGAVYSADIFQTAELCSRSHTQYFRIHEPGSAEPVTFALEYVWSGLVISQRR